MSDDAKVALPDLENGGVQLEAATKAEPEGPTTRIAADLEAVFDVPVQVSAVLGRARMEIGDLLKLGPGTVLELDRKVGEAIDIYVNNRLVARGEVILVEEKLGVTMTEIIRAERTGCFGRGRGGISNAASHHRHTQRSADHGD
jgi:flagellar motor switch protein FliN